jgi:hypothetical protein
MGSFKWAVEAKQEEKAKQKEEAQARGNAIICNHNVGIEQNKQRKLAPLAKISLREDKKVYITDELDSIAFAYSSTLEKIAACFSMNSPVPRRVHIGQGWVELPALKQLSLFASYGTLVPDPLLFRLCPNIASIEFRDITLEYRCQDVVPCRPARLPKVRRLVLSGWSALTFHPNTLYSTAKLVELRLLTGVHRRDNRHFIPPIEELEQSYCPLGDKDVNITTASTSTTTPLEPAAPRLFRPHWSWDWYLPELRNLRLNGEFAFRFQFRMLRGCPGLVNLQLDIRSANEEHTRVLTNADLFWPGSTTSAPISATTVSERIVAPVVHTLVMDGAWVVGDGVGVSVREFLKDMFPNVAEKEAA